MNSLVVGSSTLSKARIAVLIVFVAAIGLTSLYFSPLDGYLTNSRRTLPLIVTLASTKDRIAYELPLTLVSLLKQETQPDAIYLHFPQEAEVEIRALMREHVMPKLEREPNAALIEVFYLPDIGPSAKFSHTIERFKNMRTDTILAVCDDDHLYPGDWLTTLYAYHSLHPTHAAALRGYRVAKDGTWGFHGRDADNVIHGWNILQPFQVNLITAGEGYMLRAHWFSQVDLKNYSNAPKGARYVDDIWMSGNLAKLSIPRFVVPSRNLQLDIEKSHTLERHMMLHGLARKSSNDETVKYFFAYFRPENLLQYSEDPLWGGGEKAAFASHFWRNVYIPYTEQILRIGLRNGCPTYVCAFFSFVSLFNN